MKNTIDRRPTHPGAILREDTLPAAGLSAAALAEVLGISAVALRRVLREQGAVTPDIANRLGRAFGMSPEIWLRMQQAVELYDARVKHRSAYARIERIAA